MRRRVLAMLVLSPVVCLLALGGAVPAEAQERTTLTARAERARRSLLLHDVPELFGVASGVQMHLPGSEPSVALGQAQATATFTAFLRRTEEVEVVVSGTRDVGRGRGYVELRRRFRVTGTQEVRTQRVLLGYQGTGGAWVLTEVRVIEEAASRNLLYLRQIM